MYKLVQTVQILDNSSLSLITQLLKSGISFIFFHVQTCHCCTSAQHPQIPVSAKLEMVEALYQSQASSQRCPQRGWAQAEGGRTQQTKGKGHQGRAISQGDRWATNFPFDGEKWTFYWASKGGCGVFNLHLVCVFLFIKRSVFVCSSESVYV